MTQIPTFARVGALTILSLCLLGTSGHCEEPDFQSANSATEPDDPRDRKGLWRDTKYFVGYQVAVIGFFYVMPESVSSWSDEQKEGYDMSIWWDNVTHPENDSDDFYLNYILHPYWGASYYVRARERGYNNWEAFGYSVLLSSLYEFGVEALFEEASLQDLWVTPVVGSLVGRYFWRVRGNIRNRDVERGYRSTGDKWLWVLTDPLGSLNQQFDRWLGYETQIQIRPFRQAPGIDPSVYSGAVSADQEPVYGVELQIRWE